MLSKLYRDEKSEKLMDIYIQQVINYLSRNETLNAVKVWEYLINNKNISKSETQEYIKASAAESVVKYMKAQLNALSIKTIESFTSFLMNHVKHEELPEIMIEVVCLLMSEQCTIGVERRYELAAQHWLAIMNELSFLLSPYTEALCVLNYAGCLYELGKFTDARSAYEEFFTLYNNEVATNLPILPNYIIRNFIACSIACDSFSVLESVLGNLIKRKCLDQGELHDTLLYRLQDDLDKRNYNNCIKLSTCLFNVGITSLKLHFRRLSAYLELEQPLELVEFGTALLAGADTVNDLDSVFGVTFALGLAYCRLADMPNAYEAFLKAFHIQPEPITARYVYICCLDTSVNKPEVLIKEIIPTLKRKNTNKQLIEILQKGYDLYVGKRNSTVINQVQEAIESKKLESHQLYLAFKVFAEACWRFGQYQRFVEYFTKSKKQIDKELFYTRMFQAFLILKDFKSSKELISSLERESQDVQYSVTVDVRNAIGVTFLANKEYKLLFDLFEKNLLVTPKLTFDDANQLLALSEHLDISPILSVLEAKFNKDPYFILVNVVLNFSKNKERFEIDIEVIKSQFNKDQLTSKALQLFLEHMQVDELQQSQKEKLIELIDHCETQGVVSADIFFKKGILLSLLGLSVHALTAFILSFDLDPSYCAHFNRLFKKPAKIERKGKEKAKEKIEEVEEEDISLLTIEDEEIVSEDFEQITELEKLMFDPIQYHNLMVEQKQKRLSCTNGLITFIQGAMVWNIGKEEFLNSFSEGVKPVYSKDNQSAFCYVTIDSGLAKSLDNTKLQYFLSAMDKCRLIRREFGQQGVKILQGVVAELVHPQIDDRLCATAIDVVDGLNPNQPPLVILTKIGNHDFVKRLVRENIDYPLFK